MADLRSASLRLLGRDTVIYGLGVILSRAVSILLLPVYTRYLSTEDYGILQLLQMTVDVAAIMLSAGMTAGVLRFYYKTENTEERHGVIVTALVLLAALNGAGSLALFVTAPWVADLVLSGGGTPLMVRLTAGSFLFDAFFMVPLLYAQAQQRAWWFVGFNLAKLVLQLTLNLVTLVGLGWGVEGPLLSNLISNAVVGLVATTWTLRQTGFRLSWRWVHELRRFGVPYQFVTAGTFILTFGDRYFLEASHGLGAVGLYGLAYQFGFLLMTVAALPYLRAWTPQRFQLAEEPKAVRDARYNEGLLYLNLLVVTCAVGICLYIRPVLAVMAAPAFQSAADYVPVIVAAYLCQTWMDVAQFGIDVSERTSKATYATWISVVVILALYALLIPPYGPMGAAVATLLSFGLRLALYHFWSQRLWPVAYAWGPNLRLLLVGGAAVGTWLTLAPAGLLHQVALASLLLLGYAAGAWLLVLNPAERRRIWRLLGGLWRQWTGGGIAPTG